MSTSPSSINLVSLIRTTTHRRLQVPDADPLNDSKPKTDHSSFGSGGWLDQLPIDAEFLLLRSPEARSTPAAEEKIHPRDLFGSTQTTLLISFDYIGTEKWSAIADECRRAKDLGIGCMILFRGNQHMAGGVLCGTDDAPALHGLTSQPERRTVFIPSLALAGVMGIRGRGNGTHLRNSLTLIRRGQIVAQWRADDDNSSQAYNWASILRRLQELREPREPTTIR
jgi:hypothetical protein